MLSLFVLLFISIPGLYCEFKRLQAINVHTDISLPGRVNGNKQALKLVQSRSQMVYQENLLKYIEELKPAHPEMKTTFEDLAFAVVGSLATVDASITFVESLQNINSIKRERSSGFAGKPNPTNDKVHNGLQQLNSVRNIFWLLKEKLKDKSIWADKSMLEKLKEVQVYLSIHTGGQFGQLVDVAFAESGVWKTLQNKWGKTSTKFRSFKAGSTNFVDIAINGYNTVVNSLSLNEKITDGNILGLTSSITALAGDITMGITEVIAASATVSSAAGPVGYAIGATLYLVSYGTTVAQGLVDTSNLKAADYVKIFLSPLIPDPSFGVLVDVIDQYSQGNYAQSYYLLLTKHYVGAFIMLEKILTDKITGSSSQFRIWNAIVNVFAASAHVKRLETFHDNVARSVNETVRLLKPKKVLFVFPVFKKSSHYKVYGWTDDEEIRSQFAIGPLQRLSPLTMFFATYTKTSKKPLDCPSEESKGFTFCPKLADHGSDKLIFIGGDKVNDKVLLDDDTEAYGLGGDDIFVLESGVKKGVKIYGGEGKDVIDSTASLKGSFSYLNGGGTERDDIKAGHGKNVIVVNNDKVEALVGENTIIVEGKGRDTIYLGQGLDLVIVRKKEGNVNILTRKTSSKKVKAKRIIYDGHRAAENGGDSVIGGSTQFDVISLRNYNIPLNRFGVFFIEKGSTIDEYRSEFFQADLEFFQGQPVNFYSKAQKIEFSRFERVEMTECHINIFFFKNEGKKSEYIEVTGGTTHDFVISKHPKTPLLAQLATGDNRVLSGKGDDSYSIVLDEGEDVIFDKGGENILAIILPKDVDMKKTKIDRLSESFGYLIHCRKHRIKYIFHDKPADGDTIQLIIEDFYGRQITFKPASPLLDSFAKSHSIGFYYNAFEYCPGDEKVYDVEGIAPPPGKELSRPLC